MVDQSALELWREKLEDLRKAEAIASTAVAKFELKKQIEEAEQEIAELEGRKTPDHRSDPPWRENPFPPSKLA